MGTGGVATGSGGQAGGGPGGGTAGAGTAGSGTGGTGTGGSGTGGSGTGGSASGGSSTGGGSGMGGAASGGVGARTLDLVAGVRGGPGRVDGVGSTARFNVPYGVAIDAAGTLYLADGGNHTIRRVAVATGVVTTFAGSPGIAGATDGTGAGARFTQPESVASDGAGNLFVTDGTDAGCRIRKVAIATGVVTTLAESQQCDFSARYKIASDGAGNLFIVPPDRQQLQQLVIATGVVTTVVDGFTASTLAADGAGNLFATHSGSQRISKVVVATGVETTLAGSTTAGSADGTGAAASFSGPEALAIDRAGNLFVSDKGNFTIRQVVVATGVVTTLAGSPRNSGTADGTGAGARFLRPKGLASDGTGNLFVADTDNHTIRRIVTATGVVTTLAGSPQGLSSTDGPLASARFTQPKGLASDGTGNLFIADTGNHTIRRVAVAAGQVTTLAGSPGVNGNSDGTGTDARFSYPQAPAGDGAGNLFVCGSAHTLRKVVTATGVVTTLAGLTGNTGAIDGTGPDARFNFPQGLASDGSGNLFVADTLNHVVRKVVVATGVVTTVAGSPGVTGSTDGAEAAARFSSPTAVTSDGAGNLLIADTGNNTIRKLIVATGVVTTVAGSPGMSGSTDGTGPAARFNAPRALAADGSGTLFVADSGSGTVREVDIVTGRVTTIVGSPGAAITLGPLPAGLNAPIGVAIGPAGRLFILDESALLVVQ